MELNDIKDIKTVIVYGTGKTSRMFLTKLLQAANLRISAVLDGNPEKWGSAFEDYIVRAPEDLKELEYDSILIASVYFEEIKNELMEKYQVPEEKIENIIIFMQYLRVYQGIQKHYEKASGRKEIKQHGDKGKLVIYTAIFGNYDVISDPSYIDTGCDYLCFTDNPALESEVWKIVLVDQSGGDPNRKAKIYKILPHRYFSEYEWSIWVDGNYVLKGSMLELLDRSAGSSGMAFMVHMDRDCIYDEAKACIQANKDKRETIDTQMNKYRREGYPEHNGLIWGSCIIRRHGAADVVRLMERWWSEIDSGSRRDQLSFNYSVWKENICYDLMEIHTYRNKYFNIEEHIL